MKQLGNILIITFLTISPLWAQSPLPSNAQAAYWYGVAVILGMGTMFGLMIALANLYTQNKRLHQVAMVLAMVNMLLGIAGLVVYFRYPTIGWVAFLPVVTAVVGGLMVWTKRKG